MGLAKDGLPMAIQYLQARYADIQRCERPTPGFRLHRSAKPILIAFDDREIGMRQDAVDDDAVAAGKPKAPRGLQRLATCEGRLIARVSRSLSDWRTLVDGNQCRAQPVGALHHCCRFDPALTARAQPKSAGISDGSAIEMIDRAHRNARDVGRGKKGRALRVAGSK